MRRRAAWALTIILLSGCSADPGTGTAGSDVDEPAAAGGNATRLAGPVELVATAVEWNREQSHPVQLAVGGMYAAYQVVTPDCIETTGEPDPWSTLPIPAYRPVPPGTGNLSVTLDWDDTTYMRDDMVVAYKTPGGGWVEGPYQERGAAQAIPVAPGDWETGDTAWRFVVCLSRGDDHLPDSPGYRPGVAKGPMDVRIEAVA